MSMESEHRARIESEAQAERIAVKLFNEFIEDNTETLKAIGHWGDGECGYLLEVLQEKLGFLPKGPSPSLSKGRLSQAIRNAVFERDEYRCKNCGTHIDLTADHIHPETLGGEAVIGNLQTLCRSCNSKKGASL